MRWTRIPAVLDHDAMVRGDQRWSFSVSMLRACEGPRRKHSGRLVVLSVELGMPFDLSEPRVASASETPESWLSHRRPSGAALRSMAPVGSSAPVSATIWDAQAGGIGRIRFIAGLVRPCRLLTKGPHRCPLPSLRGVRELPASGCRSRRPTVPPAVSGSCRCHRR
jgi:hypothetical protein